MTKKNRNANLRKDQKCQGQRQKNPLSKRLSTCGNLATTKCPQCTVPLCKACLESSERHTLKFCLFSLQSKEMTL